jgi:RNA polymerase sigma-70 factor (ECF subfamily)
MSATSLVTNFSVGASSTADNLSRLESEFDRCADSLYRYFVVRAGDAHLADDLMQQLWLQASTGSAPAQRTEPWLRAIAKNLLRAHWRARARRPVHVPVADPQLAAELSDRLVSEDLPADVLERREVRDQLLLALTELPDAEQQLILEHYFHGRSHAEIGGRIGIGARAVEGRLYRARQMLRETLTDLD